MSDDNGEGLVGCGCLVLIILIGVGVANSDGCDTKMTQQQNMRPERTYEMRKETERVVEESPKEASVFESVYEWVPSDEAKERERSTK